MRTTIIKLVIGILCVSFTQIASSQDFYQSDVTTLLVNFEKTYMKKYEYETDREYLVEDNYTNYVMKLDDKRTLIFKVVNKEKAPNKISTSNYDMFTFGKAQTVNMDFVKRVNTGATTMYLAEPITQNTNEIYKIDRITYIEDDGQKLNYFAYPFTSFNYTYDGDHYPMEELYPIRLGGDQFELRTYFSQRTSEFEHDKHVFIKMYREVCANRAIGITVNRTPAHVTAADINAENLARGGKMILRTCQHAITMEYIPQVGIVREYYEELGKIYESNLKSIDGLPLQTYLMVNKPGGSVYSPDVPFAANEFDAEEPIFAFAESNNRLKGGTNNTTSLNINSDDNLITIGNEVFSNTSAEMNITHKVATGDTLYNLSKRYGTTVDAIRKLNNLNTNVIKIGQDLKIK